MRLNGSVESGAGDGARRKHPCRTDLDPDLRPGLWQ